MDSTTTVVGVGRLVENGATSQAEKGISRKAREGEFVTAMEQTTKGGL